jgi:putative hydrolase of the HAD superfamily
MIKHHGTDPAHFLWHTHQFPALHQMVLRESRLRQTLKKLPGKKLIFSNAPYQYACAVLKLLRIDDLFDDVFTIEHARYRPKPQMAGFIRLLRKHRLNPAHCIMVEDSVENLQAAKRLRLRTVWVDTTARSPAYVDVKIRSVMDLPRALSRLI